MLLPVAFGFLLYVGLLLLPVEEALFDAWIPLRFEFEDSQSHRPVAHARVRILDTNRWDSEWVEGHGHVTMEYSFKVLRQIQVFGTEDTVCFDGPVVEVSAEGYLPIVVPIATFTGRERSNRNTPVHVVRIQLKAGTVTPNQVEAIAGLYIRSLSRGHEELFIGTDGRYIHRRFGPHGFEGENAGTFSFTNGMIRFGAPGVPDALWNERMGTDFTPVPWCGRMYLITESDFPKLCSHAYLGWEPRDSPFGRFYLRVRDWNTKVTALPTLPPKWQSRWPR